MQTETEMKTPAKDWREESRERENAILAKLAELKIAADFQFIPFSASRNAPGKNADQPSGWPSFNWRGSLTRNSREIVSTEYSAGVGHSPGNDRKSAPENYRAKEYRNASGKTRAATPAERLKQYREEIGKAEIETGFQMEFESFDFSEWRAVFKPMKRKNPETGKTENLAINPKLADFVYSLISDSDVLNSSGFEDWAADYGYETDSRKAESIYRQCLEIALKLRNGIGADNLETLRELFQDY